MLGYIGGQKMKQTIIVAFIVVTFLSGCVRGFYHVCVDSIIDPSAKVKRNYVLTPDPKMEGVTETDLYFREYAKYVDKVLALKGFVRIEESQISNMPVSDLPIIILLRYGVESSQEKIYSVSGIRHRLGSFDTFSGAITPSTTTRSYTFITLRAVDWLEIARSGKYAFSWMVIALTQSDSGGDLRRDIPVLLAAIKPYIATNTGKMIELRLTENDKSVIEIKELEGEKK
jgi:hypothetical protein